MESGGSERQTLNLIRGLDRSIIDPSLYLLYQEGPLLEDLPRDVDVTSFWNRHSKPKWNWPGRIFRQQVSDLSRIIREKRIEVVYDRLFHMAMIAGPAVSRTPARRIATIVSPPAHDLLATERRFVWIKRRALAKSYRQADRLLSVSCGTADEASSFYRIERSKFEVVSNPIDVERVDRLRQEPWDGLPIRKNCRPIVSVGRLSEEKGHRHLLEAIGYLHRNIDLPLELHLVGDGPLRYALEQQAMMLGIREQVVFHGQVANPFPLICQAELFVLPSLYEGLPNALLEAMACRVPSIASDCPGGIQEATDGGKLCRLVAIGDAIALSNAIRHRFQQPAAWQSKLDEARCRIEQAHSLTHWLQQMQGIITQLHSSATPINENQA